jgi:hypothetical protein
MGETLENWFLFERNTVHSAAMRSRQKGLVGVRWGRGELVAHGGDAVRGKFLRVGNNIERDKAGKTML